MNKTIRVPVWVCVLLAVQLVTSLLAAWPWWFLEGLL